MHKHLHFCVYIYLSLRSESFRINISKPKTFMEILWNISNMCFAFSLNIFHIFRDTLLQIPSNSIYIFPTIAFLLCPENRVYYKQFVEFISPKNRAKKKKKKETIRDSWRELRSASRRKRLASIISHEPLCASSTQWNWIKLQGGGCDPPPLSQPQRSTVVQIVEMVSGDRGGEGTSRETVGREQIASG